MLLAKNNPFPKTSKSSQPSHHIMPGFLTKLEYDFSPDLINQNYNVVTVDWLMPFILHLIRLIEWNQWQDRNALNLLTNRPKKRCAAGAVLRYNANHRIDSLCTIFETVILDDAHWKTYDSYSHYIKNFSTKGAEASAKKRLSHRSKNVLNSHFVWQHQSYLNNFGDPLMVVIPAHGRQDYFSPKMVCKILLSVLPETDSFRKYLTDSTAASNMFCDFFKSKNTSHKPLFGFFHVSKEKA